jgi:T-complex protein 1 subunit beta
MSNLLLFFFIEFFSVFLDMENGTIADMVQLGILESFNLKRQVVISAAEAAEMVLRIDNIIRAPPRPRQRDMRHH